MVMCSRVCASNGEALPTHVERGQRKGRTLTAFIEFCSHLQQSLLKFCGVFERMVQLLHDARVRRTRLHRRELRALRLNVRLRVLERLAKDLAHAILNPRVELVALFDYS